MAAPIQISAAWFPPHQRTTATSVSQMFNALGVGVSFLLGRTLVSEGAGEGAVRQVTNLLSCYAGVAVLLFLLALLYFPSQPPSPPSNSARAGRTSFTAGLRALMASKASQSEPDPKLTLM